MILIDFVRHAIKDFVQSLIGPPVMVTVCNRQPHWPAGQSARAHRITPVGLPPQCQPLSNLCDNVLIAKLTSPRLALPGHWHTLSCASHVGLSEPLSTRSSFPLKVSRCLISYLCLCMWIFSCDWCQWKHIHIEQLCIDSHYNYPIITCVYILSLPVFYS